MVRIIRANERYHFESDWLSTYWHFSFDHYYDPGNTGFGPLRVFNDDTVQPGRGFGEHGHREMEILTYVIEGELEHRDSLGHRGVIGPGEMQRMSAGTGIRHAEYNASKERTVHLLQFWIEPAVRGLEPSYEQQRFTPAQRQGRLLLVASGKEARGALHLHQDAAVHVASLNGGQTSTHEVQAGRRAYLFVMEGSVSLNGAVLQAGDQARVTAEKRLELKADQAADFMLLDLP